MRVSHSCSWTACVSFHSSPSTLSFPQECKLCEDRNRASFILVRPLQSSVQTAQGLLIPSTFHTLTHVVLKATLGGRYHSYPPSNGRKLNHRDVKKLVQCNKAGNLQSWEVTDPGSLTPESAGKNMRKSPILLLCRSHTVWGGEIILGYLALYF